MSGSTSSIDDSLKVMFLYDISIVGRIIRKKEAASKERLESRGTDLFFLFFDTSTDFLETSRSIQTFFSSVDSGIIIVKLRNICLSKDRENRLGDNLSCTDPDHVDLLAEERIVGMATRIWHQMRSNNTSRTLVNSQKTDCDKYTQSQQ